MEKHYDRALNVYQEGIQYLPEAAPLYYRMALIYFVKGEKEKAKEYFERVIQFDQGGLRQHAQKMLKDLQ